MIGIAGSSTVLFLRFRGPSTLFSMVAAPVYIAPKRARGLPSLHTLSSTCHLWSFWWRPFRQVWGDVSLWFWCAFPGWSVMLSIFSCALATCIASLEKTSVEVFSPLVHWILYFFEIKFYKICFLSLYPWSSIWPLVTYLVTLLLLSSHFLFFITVAWLCSVFIFKAILLRGHWYSLLI